MFSASSRLVSLSPNVSIRSAIPARCPKSAACGAILRGHWRHFTTSWTWLRWPILCKVIADCRPCWRWLHNVVSHVMDRLCCKTWCETTGPFRKCLSLPARTLIQSLLRVPLCRKLMKVQKPHPHDPPRCNPYKSARPSAAMWHM